MKLKRLSVIDYTRYDDDNQYSDKTHVNNEIG